MITLEPYVSLGSSEEDEVARFLRQRPETCVILLYNIAKYGMDPGDSPFHGDYFGKWSEGGLACAGALFNLGSLFFRAADTAALEGLDEYLERLGRFPRFISGPASQVETLIRSLKERTGREYFTTNAHFMVLDGVPEGLSGAGASRRAAVDDLDELIEMARLFEEELSGGGLEGDHALRDIVTLQVLDGAARVVERDGVLVSKAEATALEGAGAHVGGVYTRREHRGRGFSTTCLSGLCGHLLSLCPAVSLVVHDDNYPAIAVYRKIGFSEVEDWKVATATADP